MTARSDNLDRSEPRRAVASVRSERELLRVLRRSGAPFQQVVLTHNRRVMLSVGDGGRALRMHRAFAVAPEEVLSAVARLFVRSHSKDRREARIAVRLYLAQMPMAARPPVRRRTVRPDDVPLIARLRQEFEQVNAEHFAGCLPAVPLFLSRAMRRRLGHFCTDPVEIVISHALCVRAAPGEAEATLRHEMIHLWQHATGRRVGHGSDFRRWARALGDNPRAAREVCWRGR